MELHVTTRTALGKKTNALRAKGFIPAELYGHNVANMHLSVSAKDFAKLQRSGAEHGILTLVTEKKEKLPVLVADIVKDSLRQTVIAIDFHQVRMDQKIHTKVPVVFAGEAPAIKKGLVLIKVTDELEIESLPGKIPAHIEAHLDTLEDVGMSIHVGDLKIPHDVKVLAAEDTVIATIADKTKEEEVPPPVAETPAEGTEAAPAAASETETK